MKKIISLIVLLTFVFSLAGCNNASALSSESDSETKVSDTEVIEDTEQVSSQTETPEVVTEETSEVTTEATTEATEEQVAESTTEQVVETTTEPEVQSVDPIIVRELEPEDDMRMYLFDGQIDLGLLMSDSSYLDSYEAVIAGHSAYVTKYDMWSIALYYASPETRLSQEVPVYRIQSYDGSEEYEVYMVTDNYEFEAFNGQTVPVISARHVAEIISQMRGHNPGEGSCPFDGEGRWYAVSVTPTSWE